MRGRILFCGGEKRGSGRTNWPEMKSQQKAPGGSVACGRSSAVPSAAAAAATAAAAAAGAKAVCEPRPPSSMATSVAMRKTSASVCLEGSGCCESEPGAGAPARA